MSKHTLYVSGMHCASCEIMVERTLKKEWWIAHPKASLSQETIIFESEHSNLAPIIANLNTKLSPLGYILSEKKMPKKTKIDTEILWTALPIGLAFLLGFFILQKSGILDFGIGGKMSPTASFLIGLVASVSSCLAVVGGLVLSLSAKASQDDTKKSKQSIFLFHAGRIIWFALLGGLLGLLGKGLWVSFTFSAILGIASSLIMIFLGLNLLGILKKNTITLPTGIFAWFQKTEGTKLAPFLIGVGTFFLPCWFTQSMQVASLASGSFVSGSLIMLAFAIGTFPMLALLSFWANTLSRSRHAPLFFACVGVVVVGLGIFAFLTGLAGLGVINPILRI